MLDAIKISAEMVMSCSGLLIAAGAGMGVDSGLPDFRGPQGFWKAYPGLGKLGMRFEEVADPSTFQHKPELAWGFYGHRLNLYRSLNPHEGFYILDKIGKNLPDGAFVYTTNVDGQFQKAGYDPNVICEIHGTIHKLQCTTPCCNEIWPSDDLSPEVDSERCLLTSPLPNCSHCGGLARPNILMYGDCNWISDLSDQQERRFYQWLTFISRPLIIELGAGRTIISASSTHHYRNRCISNLIRVNPCMTSIVRHDNLDVTMPALTFLKELHETLKQFGFYC